MTQKPDKIIKLETTLQKIFINKSIKHTYITLFKPLITNKDQININFYSTRLLKYLNLQYFYKDPFNSLKYKINNYYFPISKKYIIIQETLNHLNLPYLKLKSNIFSYNIKNRSIKYDSINIKHISKILNKNFILIHLFKLSIFFFQFLKIKLSRT